MNKKSRKPFVSGGLFLAVVAIGLLVVPIYKALADSFASQVLVGNAVPAISTAKINNDAAITLNENASTTILVTFTASDANGCGNITVATSSLYRSDITCAAQDYNNCYFNKVCTVVLSGNTCDGGTDTSADYECSYDLAYYADATADGSTQAANKWAAAIHVSDGTDIDDDSSATQEEINITTALDVTPATLEYNGGADMSANTNTGTNNSTSTITNTGNEKMKVTVAGSNLISGGNNIPVANEKFATSSFAYGTGDKALSAVAADVGLTWLRSTGAVVSDDVYFGIAIPNGQAAGTYSGSVTTTATLGV